MKILHTSDWHLGARLCDRERFDEHKAFLSWLTDTIIREKVDILIVSGDIFDTSNPPNYGETIYYDFLCSLAETTLSCTVIIGGNHDSVSKLNSAKSLLDRMNIFVLGGAAKELGETLIPVKIGGDMAAVVCAVPFLRERDIRVPTPGESWEERERSIFDGIRTYYHEAAKIARERYDLSNIPLIGTGHLFVAGSQSGEGQRDLYVGNLGSVTTEIFPEDFSYVALGHIHRAQKVGKKDTVRYCGSPIAMDFGEDSDKSLFIIDFEDREISNIRPVLIPQYRKLIRFRGTFDEVSSQLDQFEVPDSPFWADVELEAGSAAGDVSLLLNDKAAKKGFELLRIKVLRNRDENIFKPYQTVEIKDLTPEEVFKERCLNAGLNQAEEDELMPLYRELLVQIETQEDEICEN